MPALRRDKTFERLRKPCKIGMCVGNLHNRYMERNTCAFRQCSYFDRKIAKFMQLFNLINLVVIRSECGIHNSLIFRNYFIKRSIKEVFIKVIHKISLANGLPNETYNLVPSFDSAHSCCLIGDRFVNPPWQHLCVNRLVKIN